MEVFLATYKWSGKCVGFTFSSNECKLSQKSCFFSVWSTALQSPIVRSFLQKFHHPFSKYDYSYQMLAGYIVKTVHERPFKDNRLFKKQYWHSSVSTGLSATTTLQAGVSKVRAAGEELYRLALFSASCCGSTSHDVLSLSGCLVPPAVSHPLWMLSAL